MPQPAPHSKRELFLTFNRLALQGFGGVLAIAQHELVDRKQWLTREEFVESLSVSQVLPGPNVVNLSLMIGDRYFGLAGAFAALAGMLVLPLAVVLSLTVAFDRLGDMQATAGTLRGMGAAAGGLMLATAWKSAAALRTNPVGPSVGYALAGCMFIATAWLKWPLPAVLLCLSVVGVGWSYRRLSILQADRQALRDAADAA